MQATTNVYVKDSNRNNRKKMSHSGKTMDQMNIPEELVDLIRDTEEQKNYSGGLLAILVICLLLGLIALVTFLTMPDPGPVDNRLPVYFSDIFTISSLASKFEFSWKDGHLVFRNSSGHFYAVHTRTSLTKATKILSKEQYVSGMSLSFDMKVWLIPVMFRQTDDLEDECVYKLYNPSRNRFVSSGRPIIIDGRDKSFLSAIAWGPKSKYMVAIYKNNLYYSLNPLEVASFICITCKMSRDRIYGRFVGYYKERIFRGGHAFWWNNNGQFLGFLSFVDEADKKTEVQVLDSDSLYSRYRNISYTKAGTGPSLYKVDIHVFNIASQELYSFDLANYSLNKPYYIIHVQWYNGSILMVAMLSPDQSRVSLLLCDVMRRDCDKIYDKESSHWINIDEYQSVVIDHDHGYLYLALTVAGDITLRRHLARIKVNTRKKNMITWLHVPYINIVRMTYFDPILGEIYFLGGQVNTSMVDLYKINTMTSEVTCQSCLFTSCNHSQVHFLDSDTVFVHRCSMPSPATHRLIKASHGSYQSLDLETNERLREYLGNKSLPVVEHAAINLVHQHRLYRLHATIFLPRHLNPHHVIVYPVLVILPDSPVRYTGEDDVEVGWVEYVTSYLQYIVVRLDVRGTMDDKPFLSMSPLWGIKNGQSQLLMGAVKELILQRPYMDNSSVGVIGVNYGGYLASRLMTDDQRFPQLRCGVAVSPIVDFASYDSFFSEKYMGQYRGHETQYKNSRLQASDILRKKELLLVHGEDQSGVLFGQLAMFIKDLVNHNILFDLLLTYPDKTGTVPWHQDKYSLKRITTFFVNCFNRSSLQYSSLENDTMNDL